MEQAGVERFWLGIHDKANEDLFVYASDDSPIQWHNWRSGQPNDKGNGQDCAVVKIDWNGKWGDDNCDDDRSFVCFREKQSE